MKHVELLVRHALDPFQTLKSLNLSAGGKDTRQGYDDDLTRSESVASTSHGNNLEIVIVTRILV